MTNNCDLEEAKHVALQKFLELAADPSQWKYVRDWNYYVSSNFYLGKFCASITNYAGAHGDGYTVKLGDQSIFSKYDPSAPDIQKPYPFALYRDADLSPNEDQELAYKKELEKVRSDPVVAAILSIKKYHEDVECEKQRQKILKDTQESCLKIQKALKEPTKEEPEISKPASRIQRFWKALLLFRNS